MRRVVTWIWTNPVPVACVVCLLFVVSVFTVGDVYTRYEQPISVAKDLASIAGLAGIIIAAATFFAGERGRRSNRALERVKLTVDLMSRFYWPEELEEIRRALRQWDKIRLPPPKEFPDSMRWDTVWVLNFVETLAIAVDEGLLDVEIVDKMLGSPILEIMKHQDTQCYVLDKNQHIYSYEGYAKLHRAIQDIRARKSRRHRR